MKYSNHEDVFFFGCRSFLNNIEDLGKYEEGGSINAYRGVEDGLSIIVRLGSPNEIQKAKDLTVKKLKEMNDNQQSYELGLDHSPNAYLDNTQRVKDIALLENFLIRMQDVNNIVEI